MPALPPKQTLRPHKPISALCQKPTSERQRGFAYYSHRSPAIFPTMQVWFNIARFRLVWRDVCDVAYLPYWFSQVLRTLN
jgi:hypothetical protein